MDSAEQSTEGLCAYAHTYQGYLNVGRVWFAFLCCFPPRAVEATVLSVPSTEDPPNIALTVDLELALNDPSKT